MKKNILWMLAAILTSGLTVATMTACSSSDDDKTDGQPQKEILYVVKISDDVLKVANVEVNYVDQTGAKKKESMTSTMWTKNYQLFNSASLNQGIIRYMHLDMSMPSAETLAEEIKTLR